MSIHRLSPRPFQSLRDAANDRLHIAHNRIAGRVGRGYLPSWENSTTLEGQEEVVAGHDQYKT